MVSTSSGRKRVIILGATGSIGDSTLRVIRAARDEFELVGISAHTNTEKLAAIAQEFSPKCVAITSGESSADLFPSSIRQCHSALALLEEECDIVVAAMTGAAGLAPIMRAIELGRTVALANKEALVCAGSLMMEAAKRHNTRILPVDSEHNAIYQALAGQDTARVSHITLTASGGPFLTTPLDQLPSITPEQAIAHPKWNMGAKISVDSATMMNKGLELIEAHWLFGFAPDAIHIIIHPQAIIHGLVHFTDGSSIAQLSEPDMAVPISYCLNWPNRGILSAKTLSLADTGTLSFLPVDEARFRAPTIARAALSQGPAASIAFNAANEIAVEAFLARHIGFLDITPLVENACETFAKRTIGTIEDVLALDQDVRRHTESKLQGYEKRYA